MTTSHTTHHTTTTAAQSATGGTTRGTTTRRIGAILAAATLAGTLAACSSGSYEVLPEAYAGTDCVEPMMDLSSTRLGYHLQQNRVATDYEGTWFHFEVVDNQFDPCQRLSWVILEGENSDVNGNSGGTGSSTAQAVVFFNYDRMVTDPLPLQFHDAAVTRTADLSAHVEYGYVGGATAGGVTERVPVNYSIDDNGKLYGEEQLPKHVDGLRLDFNRGLPPGTATVNPYGNVHHTPWEQEIEPGMSYVPMGDEVLECEFGGPAAINPNTASCRSQDGAPFPLKNTAKPDAVLTMDMKNSAGMDFGVPTTLITGNSAGMGKPIEQNVRDDSLTKAGKFLVDTRGDEVRVTSNGVTYKLADGVAERSESGPGISPITKDRWPDDLAPAGDS